MQPEKELMVRIVKLAGQPQVLFHECQISRLEVR